jgi:hypothetical protein
MTTSYGYFPRAPSRAPDARAAPAPPLAPRPSRASFFPTQIHPRRARASSSSSSRTAARTRTQNADIPPRLASFRDAIGRRVRRRDAATARANDHAAFAMRESGVFTRGARARATGAEGWCARAGTRMCRGVSCLETNARCDVRGCSRAGYADVAQRMG